ncbi:hypothetical protein [Flavobacterium sp. U410]|jgi:hypothetical protein
MADFKTKITFLTINTVFSTKELYLLVNNKLNSNILFKKDKTLWLMGVEYKVKNVQFNILEMPEDGFNCEALIEIVPI